MSRRSAIALLILAPLLGRGEAVSAGEGEAPSYFPLQVGNWWAYEERDADGHALSRETWTVLAGAAEDRTGEFHLRSSTKRLDALGRTGGHRWEGDEYLRGTDAGVRKRYPAGRRAELEVLLLKEPLTSGTRWHDAQGDCEVTSRDSCAGPQGQLPECAIVVCRLGTPTTTVVSSTYARGIGMVRQEIDVVQFLPSLHGSGSVLLPCDSAQSGHSILELTTFHVAPR